jgi:hypothetical protein
MIIQFYSEEEFNIEISQINDTEFSFDFCIVLGGGSSKIPGTPGNFIEIGADNKPTDSNKNAADFDTAGTGASEAASAVSSHLLNAPHNSALSEMSDDENHRLVTDIEKNTWNGKQDALTFTPENQANKNQANGYCPLDGGGKVPAANLPANLMELEGPWDASTNTPTLSNGMAGVTAGAVYECTAAGTVNFGDGNVSFKIGDWAVYAADNKWYKSINTNEVTSVNGKFGAVVINPDDLDDSLTTKKFTNATEKSTWNGKQDSLGFTPENVANKKTTLTDSDTDYPTTKAVNTGLSDKMNKLPVAAEYVVTVKDASGESKAEIPTDEFWITNTTLITALLNAANWSGSTYSGTTTGAVEGQMYLGTTHLFIFKDSTFHRFAKV